MTEKQKKLIETAESLVGVPYKYGAKMEEAPVFFDCSGFIKYLYSEVGMEIPRSTIEQAEFAGKKVDDISEIGIGDIIFFKGSRGHYNKMFPEGIGHVAIYLGDGRVAHAESKRVQAQPKIIEEGGVKIETLDGLVERLKPLIIIKRIFD